MSSAAQRIDKLVNHHRGLDAELHELLSYPHPTPQDLERARELKKRKLRAKDRIAALRPLAQARP